MVAPRVSIVIDNYNYGQFVGRAIESALGQTWPQTEVVVVDDGSTDASREVIERHAGVVRVFKDNGGQGSAINAGFAASSGDLVIFLDSDDSLEPHAAQRVVSAWQPGAAKIQYRLTMVDAAGEVIDLFPPREVAFDSGDVVPLLLKTGRYQTAVMSGNAFPRAILERILPMPEPEFRIAADGYLVTLAPLFGPVLSIDEPLGTYRLHGENAWASRGTASAQHFRRTLEHDLHRYDALAKGAAGRGLSLSGEPGMRDWLHLENRISSLVLDRSRHPRPSDSRLLLGLRGAQAMAGEGLPLRVRAMLAAWFLSAGLLPRPLASAAVAWRMAPATRPWLLRKALPLFRLATRSAPRAT
ncbi:MAG TPA: glycosyltransferase [Myxococcales bacterium]|nr:glycosyltransferase [Myxococcales bacterium]